MKPTIPDPFIASQPADRRAAMARVKQVVKTGGLDAEG